MNIKTVNPKNKYIPDKTSILKKKRILLLTDEDITWQFRNLLDLSLYDVFSVKKPGALLSQIMESMATLTKDFTFEDYVIIMGGKNDIAKYRTPSFRLICNKLKTCTHTNILFTSVPFCHKSDASKNSHIYKYNVKLNDFLTKFNNYVEGEVTYIEINNEKSKINKFTMASYIINGILKKSPTKNLKFISVKNCNISDSDSVKIPIIDLTQNLSKDIVSTEEILGVEDQVSSGTFLYPRLSQISLLT